MNEGVAFFAMDTLELEEILAGAAETQRIEFKRAMPWSATSLAKDILALSNVQDGGLIILGVEDGTMNRTGLSAEQIATFNIEIMRDQMAAYADPHVDISFSAPLDNGGLQYAVIKVYEFGEVPILCRRDSSDTSMGTLYYRNRNRRMESAPVSNSNDMRDIMTRSSIKLMRKLSGYGLQPKSDGTSRLNEELEGL